MQTSELTPERLRALAETRPERGVVLSLYLNLDPREFATPPARDSQIRSLLHEAETQVDQAALEHEEEEGLRTDLARVREFLEEDLDADGAHALAVFASAPAGLWETVKLSRPVPSAAHVDVRAVIEPLARVADTTRWAVLLVNRNTSRIFRGTRDTLAEVVTRDDAVPGQHDQGGWSQARYERAVEKQVEDHLRATAETLLRTYQREAFDALLVGAPGELAAHVEEGLHAYLRDRLAGRVSVDVENSTPDDVLAAAREAFDAHDSAHEAELLERLRAGIGGGGRGVGGWDDVLGALNEQRVEALLLDPQDGFGEGVVCPQCGWLGRGADACPVDGTGVGRRDDIAEPAVEAALRQSAEVVRLRFHPDALAPHEGVGAVLRF